MQKPQLVAVDTNILLRLADAHEPTTDAWHLIERRIKPVQFIATPTVLEELANQAAEASDAAARKAARVALGNLRTKWNFQPVDFNAVQDAVAASAVRNLRESGLIAYEERNDAYVLSESAVLECILLVSRDSHLLDIDFQKLTLLFRRLDLAPPVIVSPESLLRKFES